MSAAAAVGPTAALSGVSRPIATLTLGLNGENGGGPVYSNAGFASALVGYRPGTLRYPGGTTANFWDWRQGWYQPNGPWPGQPGKRIDNVEGSWDLGRCQPLAEKRTQVTASRRGGRIDRHDQGTGPDHGVRQSEWHDGTVANLRMLPKRRLNFERIDLEAADID